MKITDGHFSSLARPGCRTVIVSQGDCRCHYIHILNTFLLARFTAAFLLIICSLVCHRHPVARERESSAGPAVPPTEQRQPAASLSVRQAGVNFYD